MMRPPTAVLVLLSCVIPMSLFPRFTVVTGIWVGHPESPFADRMALFKHVLLNDAQWSPVLNQRVKLSALSLPQYSMPKAYDKVLERVQLVKKDEDQEPTVMQVLQKLMEKTPWSGTNVNYTAYVLSSGVTCFSYNNVSFVLSLVIDRIGVLARNIRKHVENNDSDSEDELEEELEDESEVNPEVKPIDRVGLALDDIRMILAVLVDKVATVEGELAFFATGLYDFDGAERSGNDFLLLSVLEMMKEDVDKKLERLCHAKTHEEIYQYLGKYESLNTSPSPPDKLVPNDEILTLELSEFDKIIDCMIDVYDGLDVETMPIESWLEILNYKLPISMNIKFYIDGKLKSKPKDAWSKRLKRAFEREKDKRKNKKKHGKSEKKGKNRKNNNSMGNRFHTQHKSNIKRNRKKNKI